MRSREVELLEPRDVLIDYDGPRLFTFLDDYGDILLAYLYEEETPDTPPEFLAVPFDDAGVEQLRRGQLTIREALVQPRWLWKIRGAIGARAQFQRIELSSLDPATLPGMNSVIRSSLLPLLSLRMMGERIQANQVPPSVIRQALVAAEGAIRDVSHYVADVVGDSANTLRALRDLRVQRLGFGSFELALQAEPPKEELEGPDPIDEVRRMLATAVQAASNQSTTSLLQLFRNEEEGKVAFESVHALTPPGYGAIEETEVAGRLVGSARGYRLNRNSRNYVRGFFKPPVDNILNLTGRIDELDKGKQTFIVRDIDGGEKDQKFTFQEELAGDVYEALGSGKRVRVIGKRQSANRLPWLLVISPADE